MMSHGQFRLPRFILMELRKILACRGREISMWIHWEICNFGMLNIFVWILLENERNVTNLDMIVFRMMIRSRRLHIHILFVIRLKIF